MSPSLKHLVLRRARKRMLLFAVLFSSLGFVPTARAQEPAKETKFDSALVEIDGVVLFRVRGVEALPAEQRAANIAANITALASNPSFRPESLRAEEQAQYTKISGGEVIVMALTDEDARLEGIQRSLLSGAYVNRIGRAIVEYREARTRGSLAASVTRVVVALGIALAIVVLLMWLLRRAEAWLQGLVTRRAESLTTESRQILHLEGFWRTLGGAVGVIRVAIVLLVALFLLQHILVQFPWTRGTGLRLFAHVSGPLEAVGMGLVAAVPNIVFLTILFFITRYLLSFARLYFEALQRGSLRFRNFEPEMAMPAHNLLRALVIAATIVIAYPYIPGSGSDAFKGVSILVGVLFSLGSSSAVANIVAGYMIVFRRAFRVGDRVDIGDVRGTVVGVHMQVTRIRTVKNEEVSIPNSVILGSEVTNYSRPAHEGRLILHTEVAIGYGVSWRQVQTLLIEAADRTPTLLKDPPPFVAQLKLGDFAITYQINAYSDNADAMPRTYSDLHSNILDVFNENGVQIMTPAYESDPETPKIVARENWFAAPKREQKGPTESRNLK